MNGKKTALNESAANRLAGLAAQELGSALQKDRRGAAAFEFALLLPMFVTLMLGTLQYGSLYYTQNAMIGAARTAARSVAIGSQNATTAEATARTSLPNWVPAANYVVTITDAAPGSQVSARIVAPSSKAAIVPYLPMPAQVEARIVMMKEG